MAAGAVLRQIRRLQKLMDKDPKKIVGGKRAGKKRLQELEEMRNPPKEGKKVDKPVRNTRKKRREDYEVDMDYMASQPTRSSFADDITDPRLTYEDRVKLLGGKYKKGGSVKKMNKGGMLKAVPEDNKGLGNLPEDVRNKMGYMKKGGSVKKMKHGGSVKSHRGDGICKKGKTKGRMV